jgi:hypothetical protein
MRWKSGLVTLASVLVGSSVYAAPASKDIEPLMTKRGKQLVSEDFSASSIPSAYKMEKGTWSIVGGALKGVEKASDMHPATFRIDLKQPESEIFQFDFKMDGGTGTALSLNGAGGHVVRVKIAANGFNITKDGSKTDTSDKGEMLDSCKMDFEKGQWYTMIVEISGKEIIARVDDKHYAFGENAKVGTAKTNFGFPSSGDATYFDNVKVWEGQPNPDWSSIKAKLSADHPEKAPAAAAGKAGAAKGKAAKKAKE